MFDGEKDGRMVKIMPINRIATRVDLNELITSVNDAVWGYILIGALVACGLWFTWKTRGVQFRIKSKRICVGCDNPSSKHIKDILALVWQSNCLSPWIAGM